MPDQVVILFMFAVVTSFGIIWVANDMRLRFQARYLEYCFYFTLVAVDVSILPYVPGVIGQEKAIMAQQAQPRGECSRSPVYGLEC